MAEVALLSEYDVRDPQLSSTSSTTSSHEEAPRWMRDITQRLVSFLALDEGWDSYDASAPTFLAVRGALDLLVMIADPDTPAPQVVPTSEGGVQLEWHQAGIDLEIEVLSRFRSDIYYENSLAGEVWEGELGADLGQLRRWIQLLAA